MFTLFRRVAAVTLVASLSTAPLAAAQSSLAEPYELPRLSSDVLPTVAESEYPSGNAALVDVRHQHHNLYEIDVYSPSMDTVITNNLVMAAGDEPRPTLYLLQGTYGGERGSTWAKSTDYEEFFADKHVNVVSPIGGDGTLFNDWRNSSSSIGASQWQTYLGDELPAVMDRELRGDGQHAMAGLSGSCAAALNIVAQRPDQYTAAVTLSGWLNPSSFLGRVLALAVTAFNGAGVWNMWGYPDDAAWYDNDPINNLEGLRGTDLYLYSGNGTLENPTDLVTDNQLWNAFLETIVRATTDTFASRAEEAGLNVYYNRADHGVHDWPFYTAALYDAWDRTLAPSFGLS